jgi:ribosomal protein L14E/L6E/L27E
MIGQYQTVKLKNGKRACIVEILEQGKAYIADVEIAKDDYETEQISHDDIASVFIEIEKPLSELA